MEVGGWVGPGLTRNFFGKSSKNSSKPGLKCVCIGLYTCTLIQAVSYYDLSVLSMSVIGFQKKKVWMGAGWVGQVFLDFLFF